MCPRKMTFVVIMLGALSQAGWALDDQQIQAKAEFNKLVLQRNQLHAKLAQVDDQAVAALKQGKDATTFNAEQITIQDRLDLLQLRLETTAARYSFVIPVLPELKSVSGGNGSSSDSDFGKDAFERGRERTLKQLRLETLELLASLDFSSVQAKINRKP